MKKDRFGREIYMPCELHGLQMEESERNDCGVLLDRVRVEAVKLKGKDDYFHVEIAKSGGLYYGGCDIMVGDAGMMWAPSVGSERWRPKSYATPEEAYNAILDEVERGKSYNNIAAKIERLPKRETMLSAARRAMEGKQWVQMTLFD